MSKENLNDLIAGFYDADEVAGIMEDIRVGDEMIASGEVLVPDAAVVSGIKRDISKRLKSRQGRRMRIRMISIRTAIAAMIAIVAFLGIRTMVHQVDTSPTHTFSTGFFWGEDAVASNIAYELDEINDAITAISLGEDETESEDIVESLELEIMEDNGGLWK
jgi:hypothetical protein